MPANETKLVSPSLIKSELQAKFEAALKANNAAHAFEVIQQMVAAQIDLNQVTLLNAGILAKKANFLTFVFDLICCYEHRRTNNNLFEIAWHLIKQQALLEFGNLRLDYQQSLKMFKILESLSLVRDNIAGIPFNRSDFLLIFPDAIKKDDFNVQIFNIPGVQFTCQASILQQRTLGLQLPLEIKLTDVNQLLNTDIDVTLSKIQDAHQAIQKRMTQCAIDHDQQKQQRLAEKKQLAALPKITRDLNVTPKLRQSYAELSLPKHSLLQLNQIYKQLEKGIFSRKKYKQEIANLDQKFKIIFQNGSAKNAKNQLADLVLLIELELMKLVQAKNLFGHLRYPKPGDFARTLNHAPRKHHYARLMALTLREIYQSHPELNSHDRHPRIREFLQEYLPLANISYPNSRIYQRLQSSFKLDQTADFTNENNGSLRLSG